MIKNPNSGRWSYGQCFSHDLIQSYTASHYYFSVTKFVWAEIRKRDEERDEGQDSVTKCANLADNVGVRWHPLGHHGLYFFSYTPFIAVQYSVLTKNLKDVTSMFDLTLHVFERYGSSVELPAFIRTVRNIAMYDYARIFRGTISDHAEISGIPSRTTYYLELVIFPR